MTTETKLFTIEEAFNISGRGVAVVLSGVTDLGIGKEYKAKLFNLDAETLEVTAWKEWLLRRNPVIEEKEAFLLVGVKKEEVPIGTTIKFYDS